MLALRNRKTKRLLTVAVEVEEYGDYGGWEITYQTYTRAVLKLRDSRYTSDNGVIFVTKDKRLMSDLIQDGKSTSEMRIEIDFHSGAERFSLADLEVIVLQRNMNCLHLSDEKK